MVAGGRRGWSGSRSRATFGRLKLGQHCPARRGRHTIDRNNPHPVRVLLYRLVTSDSASCRFRETLLSVPHLTIYLDNLAATPVDLRVADYHRVAMLEHGANAHSVEHKAGLDAQTAIDRAARLIVSTLASDAEDILFTPGASAALWLAVEDAVFRAGSRQARIAASKVEHPSLLAALRRAQSDDRIDLTLLPVDERGCPLLEPIDTALAEGLDLLCTMAANNETGAITDIGAIGELAFRWGTRHLVDASQAAGHIDPSGFVGADLVVVSGAKIYGPRRAGALVGALTNHATNLAHDVFGSPDAPTAMALAYALQLCETERVDKDARVGSLRDWLKSRLVGLVPGLRINCDESPLLPGALHVSTPHAAGEAVVSQLWGRVAVSTGAACQSGVPGPSHVMSAIDMPDWAREGAVRIGIGRFNTEDEVAIAADEIGKALAGVEIARRLA